MTQINWIDDAYLRITWNSEFPAIVGTVPKLQKNGTSYEVLVIAPKVYVLKCGNEIIATTRRNKTSVAYKHSVKVARGEANYA